MVFPLDRDGNANGTFLANRSLVLIDFSSWLLGFRDVNSGCLLTLPAKAEEAEPVFIHCALVDRPSHFNKDFIEDFTDFVA